VDLGPGQQEQGLKNEIVDAGDDGIHVEDATGDLLAGDLGGESDRCPGAATDPRDARVEAAARVTNAEALHQLVYFVEMAPNRGLTRRG